MPMDIRRVGTSRAFGSRDERELPAAQVWSWPRWGGIIVGEAITRLTGRGSLKIVRSGAGSFGSCSYPRIIYKQSAERSIIR